MTPSEVLIKAKAIITDPEKWTKKASARDGQNHKTSVFGADACKFCAVGAVMRASYETPGADYTIELKARAILQETSPAYRLKESEIILDDLAIIYYNDTEKTTHDDVMKWFDKAIEKAKERETL